MMPKRVVLSGYFGFKNFGDEAILSVLISKLQSLKHRITVISSNPNFTVSQYNHIRSIYTFSIRDIISAILKSDILISGGGSLLQDVTSFKSLMYYLFIIFLGLILRKKVIIFAQGIGPIRNPVGQLITKLLLKNCHYVSVRDIKSQELLKSWGIESDLLCDPIFSINVPTEKNNNTVAIQLRNCKNITNDFIDRLAESVSKNFGDKTIEIFSFQDEIDLELCKEFEKNLKLLNSQIKTIIYNNLSINEVIDKFSKSNYVIAMRFHAIILALLAKSKILSINYDIKVEKLSKEFQLPMLDLSIPFKNQFDQIKYDNNEYINLILQNKKFNWSGFEKALL